MGFRVSLDFPVEFFPFYLMYRMLHITFPPTWSFFAALSGLKNKRLEVWTYLEQKGKLQVTQLMHDQKESS